MTAAQRPPAAVAELEALDAAVQLGRRPARAADHVAEIEALAGLADQVARAPEQLLQKLAETALALCDADSAGVGLLEPDAGAGSALRWCGLAGGFSRLPGDALPPDPGPPLRQALAGTDPPVLLLAGSLPADRPSGIAEALVAPFAFGAGGAGTVWVALHDGRRTFDAEDARLLKRLAQVAPAAQRVLGSLEALRREQGESDRLASALQRREAEFRHLLDALPVAAYTCDADGRITHYNAQALALWGRTPRLDDPADRYARQAEEIVIERPDGSRVTALAHTSPILDGEGVVVGAVNVLVDVSDRKSAEHALIESEQRFARFMQRLPGLAWIKDLSGRYVFVNDAAEAAFGRPRHEIVGRTDREIFPATTAERFRANDAEALAHGSGVETIETLEHPDGVHHSLVSKFPIPAADGRAALIGGVAIDVTERIRAEEALRTSEQVYRAIGESIEYGVWICDAEGRNVYASESFLKLVGLSQQQCSDLGWGTVLHPEDAERTLAAWKECVRTGRHWDAEHRFRGVDGRWHPVLARGVRIENERGETTAWAGINLDISRLKQVEQELREADRRKDEFLATLAHELRNPLAPIRNSLALLRMTGAGSGVETLLEMMERQVGQMVRLVDDLLEVSRITRGTIELRRETVALSAVVESAVETSRPLFESAHHRLEISLPDEDLLLEADPVRLAQIFTNLLNNAAKYTEPAGHISLSARREEGDVLVAVSDDGVGIPAERLSDIFDLFTQVDETRSRVQGGLGIGLTLVQRLTQLHGGRVEARSEGPGRGSEFRVTLPLASRQRAPAGARTSLEPPARVAAPRRVLVVDDNRDAADSLAALLGVLGADCHVAYDGGSALDAIPSLQPEMVFLDLGMPGIDGYEVARRIRRPERGAAPFLVALTGWGQPDDRRRTREAGFDQHLVKPVDLGALRSLLALLETRPA